MNVLVPFCLMFSLIAFLNRDLKQLVNKIFGLFFILLFLLLAFRYKFGPDYTSYMGIFNSINGVNLEDYAGHGSSLEIAFLYYMQFFPCYTFFVASISCCWLYACFQIFKRYANYKYYWFIIIFLIIDPNSITGASVAMRTTFSSVFFLFGFILLNRKGLFGSAFYLSFVLIASLFHTSSLLFLPFVLLKYDNKDFIYNRLVLIPICFLAVISVLLGTNPIVSMMSEYLFSSIDEFQRYESYEAFGVVSSFNSLIFRILTVFILIYIVKSAIKDCDEKYKLLYKFAIMSLIITLLLGQHILSDRILTYLGPIYISAISRSCIFSNKKISNVILIFIFLISSYLLYSKMIKDYASSFLTYQTIFDAPFIP